MGVPMKRVSIAGIIAIILFLASCISTKTEWDYSGIPAEQKEMWWLFGENQVRFWTNDPANLDRWFWNAAPSIPEKTHVFEVKTKKWSGSRNTGFGMNFCHDQTSNSYYRMFITLTQWFRIEKYENLKMQSMFPGQDENGWVRCGEIKSQYNAENTLKVVRKILNGDTAKFDIYINNKLITSFTDTNPIVHNNGMSLAVSVSKEENEKFPDVPVEVLFRY